MDAREQTGSFPVEHPKTPLVLVATLGIVFGDLGTSPLYAMQTIVDDFGGKFTSESAVGILSLLFWSLIITISIKYCVFVMRADNNGEGGILALMSSIDTDWHGRGRALIVMGLFGAALIYGDGVITPSISVLSALEGLDVATDVFKPHIVLMASAILLLLFLIQSRGTASIGRFFGPVMLVWFAMLAILGVRGIAMHPSVLAAVSPHYALELLAQLRWRGFVILGGVFLAITGGEALYADMGHFGAGPIRAGWYCVVLPALLLNYAGQTALVVAYPATPVNPFFELAPRWSIYPLVAIATAATIIASQAIITGSFSLTRQAMQLGWLPGVRIKQTSADEYGQIYVPLVNWMMMLATVALTVTFRTSENLAGAYGTAVSTTMLLTTMLLYNVMRGRWGWPPYLALLICGLLLIVDLGFFSANLLKIDRGGWIPLTLGALIFVAMTTWRAGIEAVHARYALNEEASEHFLERIRARQIPRVPGVAIFLTRARAGIPAVMIQYFAIFGALREQNVALTVQFENYPHCAHADRLSVTPIAEGLWHITMHYGFNEVPNIPMSLRAAPDHGCPVDFTKAVYFAERDEATRGKHHPRLWKWQVMLFDFMFRNSVRPVDLFTVPAASFVEIGRTIEI
ncbi:MAG TPA: KUP/HAK/KT family potassium transporter [Candidatus Binataceae bacterium]|nr:KUP/HAK/KT family potassium transporter [Candidatus Binataceae bacterium]